MKAPSPSVQAYDMLAALSDPQSVMRDFIHDFTTEEALPPLPPPPSPRSEEFRGKKKKILTGCVWNLPGR